MPTSVILSIISQHVSQSLVLEKHFVIFANRIYLLKKFFYIITLSKKMLDISYEKTKQNTQKGYLIAGLPILQKKTIVFQKKSIQISLYKIRSNQEAFTEFLYLLDEEKSWLSRQTQMHLSYYLAIGDGR